MAYVSSFDPKNYQLTLRNTYVLQVYYYGDSSTYFHYDYLARVLTVATGAAEGGRNLIPFSRLDPETLHFFREQLIELGGRPPELPADIVSPSAPTTEEWVDMGDDSMAHVAVYPALQKKITQIFNFASRQLDRATENLRTHQETAAPTVGFNDVHESVLERAMVEFEKYGHKVDRRFVLSGVKTLSKPLPRS